MYSGAKQKMSRFRLLSQCELGAGGRVVFKIFFPCLREKLEFDYTIWRWIPYPQERERKILAKFSKSNEKNKKSLDC